MKIGFRITPLPLQTHRTVRFIDPGRYQFSGGTQPGAPGDPPLRRDQLTRGSGHVIYAQVTLTPLDLPERRKPLWLELPVDPGRRRRSLHLQFVQHDVAVPDEHRVLGGPQLLDPPAQRVVAVYLRGSVYQKLKKLPEAEADFRAALALDAKLTDVRAELGALLNDDGRAKEAAELFEQVLKEKPDHFEACYNLGTARDALGQFPAAAEAYRRAGRLHPQDPDARLNLTATLHRMGKSDEALVAAREAVKLAPGDALARLNAGLLLSDAKKLDEAAVELGAAVRLKPDFAKAWWRLGVVQLRRDQPKLAVAALEKARELGKTKEVLSDLGLAQRKLGDLAAAEASFRAALAVDDKHHPARVHLAATQRCKDALKELSRVSSAPNYAEPVGRIRAQCAGK